MPFLSVPLSYLVRGLLRLFHLEALLALFVMSSHDFRGAHARTSPSP